jgi:hypothetical protein
VVVDPGTPLDEIALPNYKRRLIERLTEVSEPDTDAVELPILPAIERFRPIDSKSLSG